MRYVEQSDEGMLLQSFGAADVFERWRASIIRGHPCGLQRQSSAHSGARQFTSMKNRCSAGMK